jgi:hypothetical protein
MDALVLCAGFRLTLARSPLTVRFETTIAMAVPD